MTKGLLAKGSRRKGWDQNRISFDIASLTFIMLKRTQLASRVLLPCRFMTSSDTSQSGGAQVPSLQSLSRKTHSIWPLRDAHYSRQEELLHAPRRWWRRQRGQQRVQASEWHKDGRRQRGMQGQGPETRRLYVKGDKVMESLTTQWRHITCAWCIAIKYHGHLQPKINWPLRVSIPRPPPPLLLPHYGVSIGLMSSKKPLCCGSLDNKWGDTRWTIPWIFFCALQEGAFW